MRAVTCVRVLLHTYTLSHAGDALGFVSQITGPFLILDPGTVGKCASLFAWTLALGNSKPCIASVDLGVELCMWRGKHFSSECRHGG